VTSTDKGKLPWMKFYPADWRADPTLRMCSLAARGLWMEMLSLMHEADPRGSLLVNGSKIAAKQLASLCGATLRETIALIAELEAAGVFSRAEDGAIFSRRMKRDGEKAERDKANGKTGGNPRLIAGVNPPDKAQRPDAISQKLEPKERTRASALAAPWTEADCAPDRPEDDLSVTPVTLPAKSATRDIGPVNVIESGAASKTSSLGETLRKTFVPECA
jgi:hypothetical protein